MSVEGINNSVSSNSNQYETEKNRDEAKTDEFKSILKTASIINEVIDEWESEIDGGSRLASGDKSDDFLTLQTHDPLDKQQAINIEIQKEKGQTSNQKKAAGND